MNITTGITKLFILPMLEAEVTLSVVRAVLGWDVLLDSKESLSTILSFSDFFCKKRRHFIYFGGLLRIGKVHGVPKCLQHVCHSGVVTDTVVTSICVGSSWQYSGGTHCRQGDWWIARVTDPLC